MNDRELLELAAKAAGYDVEMDYYGDCRHGLKRGEDQPRSIWNPLESDGDALRLAVKLGIHVGICLDLPVGDCSYARIDYGEIFIEPHHEINPEIATRRAVVRIAAEIGKQIT